MRPKDLKFPFTWEERRPALHEGLLIVPKYYEGHDAFADTISFSKPLHIEYCSGNGDWVLERAQKDPESQWVAVEQDFERVRKIWSKMRNRKVENLLIVCGEAHTFTRYYLPNETVAEIFINFPDPWPKSKHAKHRLIQEPFAAEVGRVVKKGGLASFATDDFPYASQMIEVMRGVPSWETTLPDPYFTFDWTSYGSSWFSHLWTRLGRTIHYMQFRRV